MKTRLLSTLVALCMLLTLLPPGALAADSTPGPWTEGTVVEPPSYLNESLYWAIVSGPSGTTQTLYIYPVNDGGSGAVPGYALTDGQKAPWRGNTGSQNTTDYSGSITDVVLCEGVTGVGSLAFYGCNKMRSLSIPATCTSIAPSALNSCAALEAFTVALGSASFSSDGDGVLYNADRTTLVRFPAGSSLTDYTVPSSVRKVEEYAFQGTKTLNAIHLPVGLETGEQSFYWPWGGHPQTVYYAGTAAQWRQDFSGRPNGNEKDGLHAAQRIVCNNVETVRVTYSGASGGLGYIHPTILEPGEAFTVTAPPAYDAATRYGFTPPAGGSFVGWKINGTLYRPGDTCSVTADAAAEAVWFETSVTVSFDANGGSAVSPVSLPEGGAYGTLPVPTRPGCTFAGWFTALNGGTPVTADTKVPSGDHTLYAAWIEHYQVNFNVNGAVAVAPASITVTRGQPYGSLPAPSWIGHVFLGWFTEATGGTEITENTLAELTGDQTLYAHWSGEAPTYTVLFDANGGAAPTPAGITVTQGAPYGSLPVSSRPGYVFLGWFTDPAGGTKVESGTVVSLTGDQTLYAHWEAERTRFTVTFDANGGAASLSSKEVVLGEPYGELPEAERTGYFFDGWYTAPQSGAKISDATVFTLGADQTLYAHWTEDLALLNALTYRFPNSRGAFGYQAGYHIPYERFQMVYGDTALATVFYRLYGPWIGNCSGITTSAILFYHSGNGVNAGDFKSRPVPMPGDPTLSLPSDLFPDYRHSRWDISLRTLIEGMQIRGYSFMGQKQEGYGDLTGLWQAVADFQSTGEDPVYIALWRGKQGHALIGYRTEEVSATEGRVYVYDCNFPGSTDYYITFRRANAASPWSSWYYSVCYDGSGAIYYSVPDGVPPSWLADMASRSGGAAPADTVDPSMEALIINSNDAVIRDDSGREVARVVDGSVVTSRTDVYPILCMGDILEGGVSVQTESPATGLWLPVGLYTVTNQDGSVREFEAVMVHVAQAATVRTTGDVVSFAVDDAGGADGQGLNYVRLAESGEAYSILLESAPAAGTGGKYMEWELTGARSTEAVSFARIDGELYTGGVDPDDSGVTLDIRENGNVYPDVDLDAALDSAWGPDGYGDYAGTHPGYGQAPDFAEVPWTENVSKREQLSEMPEEIGTAASAVSVRFHANGGSGEMSPGKAVRGTPFLFPGCGFTAPAGKEFDGWTVGSGENAVSVGANAVYTITDAGAVDVYAQWKDRPSGGLPGGSTPGSSGTPGGSIPGGSTGSSGRPGGSTSTGSTGKPGGSASAGGTDQPDGSAGVPDGGTPGSRPAAGNSELPFRDVADRFWARSAIQWAYEAGYMTGTGAGTFTPGGVMTRAMAWTVLARMSGLDTSGGSPWYEKGMAWAVGASVSDGSDPDGSITREQLVTMLWRYAGRPDGYSDLSGFTDAGSVSAWADSAVRWAVSTGILLGANGALHPSEAATRAETAAVLMRFCEKFAA